jgi:hypothetical protein
VNAVGTAVTVMESVMVEVVQLNSVEQHITAAIKNSIALNEFGVLALHLTTREHYVVL